MDVWYRAYFDLVGTGDMTDECRCISIEPPVTDEKIAQADAEAIEWANDYAAEGAYFADDEHVELDLVELHEVDGNKECFPNIRCVWN